MSETGKNKGSSEAIGNYEVSRDGLKTRREVLMMGAVAAAGLGVAGMAAQIDQNINRIVADFFGQRRVGKTGNRMPMAHVFAQALCDVVVIGGVIGVGVQRQLPVFRQLRQHRFDIGGDRVVTQVA